MFQVLFTTSLVKKDLSFLKKLPPVLLDPDQQEAVNWVVDYETAHGIPPKPSRVQQTPHARWCQQLFQSSYPLSDIYAQTIETMRKHRKRILADDLADADDDTAAKLIHMLSQVQSSVAGVSTISLKDMDRDALYAPQTMHGITFGLTTIDSITHGLLPGENAYFAGRPGDGKTMILCHIAVHLMKLGRRVFFNSKEMPNESIVSRLDGIIGGFDTSAIRTLQTAANEAAPDLIGKLAVSKTAVIDQLGTLPGDIIFPRTPCSTPRQLFAAALQSGAEVIIADGVYLMASDEVSVGQAGSRDWRVQAGVTSEIKQHSLESRIPAIGSTQLSRQAEEGTPSLKSVAFSDALGQDADIVILMTRLSNNNVSLLIGKNRNGIDRVGQVIQFDFSNGAIIEGGSLND